MMLAISRILMLWNSERDGRVGKHSTNKLSHKQRVSVLFTQRLVEARTLETCLTELFTVLEPQYMSNAMSLDGALKIVKSLIRAICLQGSGIT